MTNFMSEEGKGARSTFESSMNETPTHDFLLLIETFSTKTRKIQNIFYISTSAEKYALAVDTEHKRANQ